MNKVLKFRQFVDGKFHFWGFVNNNLTDFVSPIPGYPSDRFIGIDVKGNDIYEKDIIYALSWWWGAKYIYLIEGECGACTGDSVFSYILSENIKNPLKGATYNLWGHKEVQVIGSIQKTPELIGFGEQKDLFMPQEEEKVFYKKINKMLLELPVKD